MDWTGKWKNQYGSVIEITEQDNGRLSGTFESAVDHTTKGQKLPLSGFCRQNMIAVSCAGGDHVVSYTGLYEANKLQTVWHVVTSGLPWWQSVKTNVDTFERLS